MKSLASIFFAIIATAANAHAVTVSYSGRNPAAVHGNYYAPSTEDRSQYWFLGDGFLNATLTDDFLDVDGFFDDPAMPANQAFPAAFSEPIGLHLYGRVSFEGYRPVNLDLSTADGIFFSAVPFVQIVEPSPGVLDLLISLCSDTVDGHTLETGDFFSFQQVDGKKVAATPEPATGLLLAVAAALAVLSVPVRPFL